jgi:hypothetical protein
MFIKYVYERLTSTDRVEKSFSWLIFYICGYSLFFIIKNLPFGHINSSITGIWLLSLIYIIYKFERYRNFTEACRFVIYVTLMFTCLIYYNGTNYIQNINYNNNPNILWDKQLLEFDNVLFGSFWKYGQYSLYLDAASTTHSRIYVEILQLFYISYYFLGNFLAFYLLCIYYYRRTKTDKIKQRLIYRIIMMFCVSWCSSFLITYSCNYIFPAVSPRIYISHLYTHNLDGLWFTSILRDAITVAAANTYGAFPSAHCAISIVLPIITYRLGLVRYTIFTSIAAVFIILSTIVLRYHYFVDAIFSVVVVYLSIIWGGFHSQKVFLDSLELGTSLDMDTFFNDDKVKETSNMKECSV